MLRGGILVSVQYGTQVRIILLITVNGGTTACPKGQSVLVDTMLLCGQPLI